MSDTKPEGPANYIDALAGEIGLLVPDQDCPQDLLRLYAVLALTRGTMTTLEDVHDTWSAWMAGRVPSHPALVPFAHLSPEVQQLDWPYAEAVQMAAGRGMPARTRVVCLCGSTRFVDEFNRQRKALTEAGEIVLSIEVVTTQAREDDPQHCDPALKARLDELHKRKIDMADYCLILNVGGYIGESTRGEIDYAFAAGKEIKFLESIPIEAAWADGWVPGAPKAVRS